MIWHVSAWVRELSCYILITFIIELFYSGVCGRLQLQSEQFTEGKKKGCEQTQGVILIHSAYRKQERSQCCFDLFSRFNSRDIFL